VHDSPRGLPLWCGGFGAAMSIVAREHERGVTNARHGAANHGPQRAAAAVVVATLTMVAET
jgi:hypothetical protein